MKKRKTARNRVFTFTVLLVFVLSMFSIRAFPVVSTSTSAGESPLSARIWVDKGCDGHYKGGERITIFFEVKSSELEAAVTILLRTPDKRIGHVISSVVYPTNAVHSLSAIAECPKGRYRLDIFVANVPSPPSEGPPDEIQVSRYIDIDNSDASDECFFYVDPPCFVLITDNDNDGYSPPNDCNDNNSHIHPGAEEKCDQKDNDCDGQIDEGCYPCLIDNDQDGYTTCNDCNDHDRSIHPRASEFCDGKDNDCDGQIDEDCVTCSTDIDGDGYTNCDDCNDYDLSVYPGAAEACDGKDNDCDGQIDEGCPICFTDYDEDGFSACSDCNDNNPYVYPGAPEFCDDKDNDCDGQVDEGLNCGSVDIWIGRGCGASYDDGDTVGVYFKVKSSVSSAEVTITRFPPKDGLRILVSDRVYQTNTVHHLTTTATCFEGLEILIIVVKVVVDGKTVILFDYCAFYVVGCRTLDSDGDGHVSVPKGGDDCDDHDSDVHPGAEEKCDRKDNDCNGLIDEGRDCEYVEVWVDKKCGAYYNDEEPMEVYFRVNSSTSSAEVTIMHFPSTGEPNIVASGRTFRTNEVYHFPMFAVCPKGLQAVVITVEVVLEGKTVVYTEDCTFYVTNCRPLDSDGDGYVSVPKGGDDCDDDDAGVYPGAEEECDGKDNDCDKKVDEGFDTDNDGYTECENDCNENDPDVNPGAEEECNDNIDNDCDKEVDETADKDNDGYRAIECGGDDCDDNNPDVNPGAEEECDQKDNNCNGLIDEGFDKDNDGYKSIECGGNDCDDNNPDVNPGAKEECDQKDNNCNGLVDEYFDMDNDGYTSCGGDCDDNNPDVNPGAEEVCDDNVDNDCDEDVDETADKDNDWYKSQECGGNDCDDSNASIHPGAKEICDKKDNDCDGQVDENLTLLAPVLTGPENQSIIETLDSLIWNPVKNASTYRVQIATDSAFANIEVDEIVSEKYIGEFREGEYFWRVKAINDCTESGWSNIWSFAIGIEEEIIHPMTGDEEKDELEPIIQEIPDLEEVKEALKFGYDILHNSTSVLKEYAGHTEDNMQVLLDNVDNLMTTAELLDDFLSLVEVHQKLEGEVIDENERIDLMIEYWDIIFDITEAGGKKIPELALGASKTQLLPLTFIFMEVEMVNWVLKVIVDTFSSFVQSEMECLSFYLDILRTLTDEDSKVEDSKKLCMCDLYSELFFEYDSKKNNYQDYPFYYTLYDVEEGDISTATEYYTKEEKKIKYYLLYFAQEKRGGILGFGGEWVSRDPLFFQTFIGEPEKPKKNGEEHDYGFRTLNLYVAGFTPKHKIKDLKFRIAICDTEGRQLTDFREYSLNRELDRWELFIVKIPIRGIPTDLVDDVGILLGLKFSWKKNILFIIPNYETVEDCCYYVWYEKL